MDAANLDVAADSGPAELHAIYQANLGYDVDRDVTACGRFLKACRAILALPTSTNNAVEGVSFNRELVQQQFSAAHRWLMIKRRKRPRVFVVHSEYSR